MSEFTTAQECAEMRRIYAHLQNNKVLALLDSYEAALRLVKDVRRCSGMVDDDHTSECRYVCSSIEDCDCGYEALRQFAGEGR